MGVELKPCPFCGGTAHVEQPGTRRQSCVVECDSCGIRHESGDEGSMCGTAWNRREGEAARIQQQALEYVSLFDQCSQHLARIAELEKERDALKADSERWREFAEHQTWCADCADSVSTCPIGSRLSEAALQAEKETR